MREQEIELLTHLVSLSALESDSEKAIALEIVVKQAFEMLQRDPIGTVSPEFLENPLVNLYIKARNNYSLKLWYFIHTQTLCAIEEQIQAHVTEYQEELELGFGIPSDYLYSSTLVRSVYLSDNTELIDIFKRYLPLPSTEIFKKHEIPKVVSENKNLTEHSIRMFRKRSPALSMEKITDKVVKIQRLLRSKLRHQEEIKRISSRLNWKYLLNTTTERLIQDANKPYRPKCIDQTLARRIMLLAQQVHLFSTVKHWTSGDHIESIFNDALYGRRHLLQSYLPFRPASLFPCDIEEGDGNVICMGPFDIDPQAMQDNTVELRFDLNKLSANNPTIFFKQLDFGFKVDKKRSVSIPSARGAKQLFFSHTSNVEYMKNGFSCLSVYHRQWACHRQGVSVLPNFSLISYNVQNIHQILTLNFFRFLDSQNNQCFEPIRNEIYADLGKLNDEELLLFLQDIGQKLSDTSELNFYAAHRIDFSTLIGMSYYLNENKISYSIIIQDLIDSLERNDLNMLNRAKINIPGAFSSYRFLDYLLSKTTSTISRRELQKLRSKCTTPSFIECEAEDITTNLSL